MERDHINFQLIWEWWDFLDKFQEFAPVVVPTNEDIVRTKGYYYYDCYYYYY